MSKSPVRWFDPSAFRELRERHGFTYAALGRATGLTPATFRHWESGLFSPSMEGLVLALEALNSTPAQVLIIPPDQLNLADLRVLAAFPGQDAAEALGLTPSGFSAIERGELRMTDERAQILARIYDVTVDDVYQAWSRAR